MARSGAWPVEEPVLGRLRRELGPTLALLERAASDPDLLVELEDDLAGLRYALHVAAERTPSLAPWLWVEEGYERLSLALADARDETAYVSEALALGGREAAAGLVWEWRAALFGVRLALREVEEELIAGPPGLAAPRRLELPVLPLVLGVAAVVGGALVHVWPLWLAGFVVVAAVVGRTHALVTSRP